MTPEPTFRERALARAGMLDSERDGTHLPALARVVQTCRACPSQWDAWDADGQYYYLRYRCGRGTVETAGDSGDYRDPETPNTLVANFNHGDSLDGTIDLDEFLYRAGMRLAKNASVE